MGGLTSSRIYLFCKIAVIASTTTLTIVYMTIDFLIWNTGYDTDNDQLQDHYELNITFLSILMVSYTISFVFLCFNIARLPKGHLDSEVTSV